MLTEKQKSEIFNLFSDWLVFGYPKEEKDEGLIEFAGEYYEPAVFTEAKFDFIDCLDLELETHNLPIDLEKAREFVETLC